MTGDIAEADLARRVEAFLFREARLLDLGEFEAWLQLYTETATYWVPTRPGQTDPHHCVSIVYDDRRLMETRVRRLSHPKLHAQHPPSRTSRLISNVLMDENDPEGMLCVDSVFQMTEFRNEVVRFFSGSYRHRLRREPGGFRIQAKRVDLVNCDAAFAQISIPF